MLSEQQQWQLQEHNPKPTVYCVHFYIKKTKTVSQHFDLSFNSSIEKTSGNKYIQLIGTTRRSTESSCFLYEATEKVQTKACNALQSLMIVP